MKTHNFIVLQLFNLCLFAPAMAMDPSSSSSKDSLNVSRVISKYPSLTTATTAYNQANQSNLIIKDALEKKASDKLLLQIYSQSINQVMFAESQLTLTVNTIIRQNELKYAANQQKIKRIITTLKAKQAATTLLQLKASDNSI